MRNIVLAAAVTASAALSALVPAAAQAAAPVPCAPGGCGDAGRSNVNAPQFGLANVNGDVAPCAAPWSDGVNVTIVNNKRIAQCQERTYTDQGQNAETLSGLLGQNNLWN